MKVRETQNQTRLWSTPGLQELPKTERRSLVKTLYLDCSSGISGDMTVAALLDLGADEKGLLETLASLPLEGYQIRISRVKKSGIDACDFDVVLDDPSENRDHDMAYLHGDLHKDLHNKPNDESCDDLHEGGHEHEHDHVHGDHLHSHAHEHTHDEHPHEHAHEHAHDEHSQGHVHDDHHHEHHGHHGHHGRNLDDIRQILYSGALNDRALGIALNIFEIVAQAEASVHGLDIDEVHFHEVGAVDSIIDIAAIAFCIDDLNIGQVIIPSLSEGTGHVRCRHGLLPIPVPATSAIVSVWGLPLRILPIEGELVTPTGAAVAAALCTSRRLPEHFTIERIGVGAGKREYAVAGILRAMLISEATVAGTPAAGVLSVSGKSSLASGNACFSDDQAPESGSAGMVDNPGVYDTPAAPYFQLSADTAAPDAAALDDAAFDAETQDTSTSDTVLKIEANLDDATGESLGYLMDRLFAAGALDVFFTPITMKKSRPGVMLSLLCQPDVRPEMESLIFRHTTCIGLRFCLMQRTKLEREVKAIETPLGEARVKYCFFGDEVYCYPEHQSVADLAERTGLGYKEVYSAVKHFALGAFTRSIST